MANLSSKTGFTPVQTRVTLANNATTSVQEFAAYDGQELTGFVFIDATTDYRATVKIQVVKNGAGTYEVAAADIAGDDNGGSPIVSFSMSGSVLRATLVSYAGFVSAYIQYNLNAPALGANFPLTIDGSNVTLATPTVQGAYKAGQAPGLATGAAIGAGFIGELKENIRNVLTPNVTSGQVWSIDSGNVTYNDNNEVGIILTAGVWAIQGIAHFSPGTSTVMSFASVGIGTAKGNAATGFDDQRNRAFSQLTFATGPTDSILITPVWWVNINSTITYYCKGQAQFSGGTLSARGSIRALRIA